MTRPNTESSPDNLFDAIAQLLEPGQREYFYQRMLYFRHLRSEDELLRIVEALGFLALVIRDAPKAVAIEREQLATILASSIASIQATAQAGQAYHKHLEDRLTRLPRRSSAGSVPKRSHGRLLKACANSLCTRVYRRPRKRSGWCRTN